MSILFSSDCFLGRCLISEMYIYKHDHFFADYVLLDRLFMYFINLLAENIIICVTPAFLIQKNTQEVHDQFWL